MRGGARGHSQRPDRSGNVAGLPWLFIWRSVILPQLYHLVLPPLVNEFTLVIKATTLVSVITVVEMMRVAQELYNENYRPIEVLLEPADFRGDQLRAPRVASQLERMNAAKFG